MPSFITFETFDPTPYQRAPLLTILNLLALGRALLEVVPEEAPEGVQRAARTLEAVLDEGDEAVDTRHQESVPVDPGDVELDGVADGLWAMLRNGLRAKATLPTVGLARLAEGKGPRSAIGKQVAAATDQAARARALSTRIFGADGLAFTQKQFPEQSQIMASMLRVIDKQGLAAEIDALVGPEILALLRACQPLYASMVDARLARDRRKTSDLGRMRAKIMRAITRYTTAVLGMLDEAQPASLPAVIAALRPVEQIRSQTATATATASAIVPADA